MTTTRVKLFGDSVNAAKIAADTIIPADIDETQAYNWTGNSSSYVGSYASIATLSGTTVTLTTLGVKTVGGSNQFAGSLSFASALTSTAVPNTAVTASAQILFGYDSDPVVRFYTSARSASTSFTITASSAPGADIVINYLMIK